LPRPRKKFKQNFFELFLKIIPLYVSDDAAHFRPIYIFFDFCQLAQLANWPLIGSSENFIFEEKVVPLFNSNTLVKLRSHSELQKAIEWIITACNIKNKLKAN